VAERGLGEVRAPDRLARRAALLEHRVVDRPSQLLERLAHPVRARGSVVAVAGELGQEVGVVVVEAVAEDVQVLELVLHAGDLRRRHDRDAADGLCGRDRLVDAVDRVVVGQREQLDAGLLGEADDLGGGQRAVGVDRVRLQVERGRAH
jgi:hypothetical protein